MFDDYTVQEGFLNLVKSQIISLSLDIGMECVNIFSMENFFLDLIILHEGMVF